MHQEPETEKPPRHQAAANPETFASELLFRASSVYSLKAPWRLLARLPEPMQIGSLLMLYASLSQIADVLYWLCFWTNRKLDWTDWTAWTRISGNSLYGENKESCWKIMSKPSTVSTSTR
jgi:hypothetical protein